MAKKTKKIETPIDQRETFVSIQKSFADSDLTVAEKLKTLYALQQADTEIDKILQLRGELPMEVEALETELVELNAKAERISELIEGYTRSISDNKLNIAECDAQIEKYKSQMDNVANSREYDSLSKEIENQGLLRQIAEKSFRFEIFKFNGFCLEILVFCEFFSNISNKICVFIDSQHVRTCFQDGIGRLSVSNADLKRFCICAELCIIQNIFIELRNIESLFV